MAGYYQDETGKTVKASNYDEAAKKLYQPAYYVGWKWVPAEKGDDSRYVKLIGGELYKMSGGTPVTAICSSVVKGAMLMLLYIPLVLFLGTVVLCPSCIQYVG